MKYFVQLVLRPWQRLGGTLAVCILVVATHLSAGEKAEPSPAQYIPFQAGDRFQYDLFWSRIKVGEAELTFVEDALPADPDKSALRMTFTVRTSGIANRIYRVDNRMETWLDAEAWRPLHHVKRQREGRRERDIELFFDWDNETVTYVNSGNANEPLAIEAGTQDPLSLLGEVARRVFEIGAVFEIPASDGRRLSNMQAEVVEREVTRTPLGYFDSVKLDVSTDELRGVFAKSPDAVIEVWFTDDNHRVPLRMRSEVVVGSFYGELTGFESSGLSGHEMLPSFVEEVTPFRSRRGRR